MVFSKHIYNKPLLALLIYQYRVMATKEIADTIPTIFWTAPSVESESPSAPFSPASVVPVSESAPAATGVTGSSTVLSSSSVSSFLVSWYRRSSPSASS